MKKFWGKRPLNEILKVAKEQGFNIDTTSYNDGRDYVWFAKKYEIDLLSVGYNTFNGQFLGTYWDIEFSSNDTTHDNEPRMNALFNLFYLPISENQKLPKYMD